MIALYRREILTGGLGLGAAAIAGPLAADHMIDHSGRDGPAMRPIGRYPTKGEMIIQRVRPALLETPMEVFYDGVLTPIDRFFVRWHHDYPKAVDAHAFRLAVRGAVARPAMWTLQSLLSDLPRTEIVAVNQCSGNSRSYFDPRVPGGQWGNGAMGNARWTGVRLRDVLDRAGVRPDARHVRFTGLDVPIAPGTPRFRKSLDIDHARDGEVMIAFQMNGEQLPILNGFPLRLIVPGWYSTYWIKMLSDIEVLAGEDGNFWMAKAYRIPTTPNASVPPGAKDFPTVPINRMIPRSFLTTHRDGETVDRDRPVTVGGIAMGGAHGVAKVDVSLDSGRHWYPATLGDDPGRYSFRRWSIALPPVPHNLSVLVRATNTAGETQPMTAGWNPGGYMRNVVERTRLVAA